MLVQAVLAIAILIVLIAISLQTTGRGTGARTAAVGLGTLGGLAAGIGIGITLMGLYGEGSGDLSGLPVAAAGPAAGKKGAGPGAGGMMKGAGPMTGGATKGAGPGGGGGNPKTQLVALVAKLDQLVDRPLALELNDEAKAKLRQSLDGLESLHELTRDEAKARLDAILELLRDQRPTLEAAGYRWPGGGGRGGMGAMMGPSDPLNPFQETSGSGPLRSLRERLPSS